MSRTSCIAAQCFRSQEVHQPGNRAKFFGDIAVTLALWAGGFHSTEYSILESSSSSTSTAGSVSPLNVPSLHVVPYASNIITRLVKGARMKPLNFNDFLLRYMRAPDFQIEYLSSSADDKQKVHKLKLEERIPIGRKGDEEYYLGKIGNKRVACTVGLTPEMKERCLDKARLLKTLAMPDEEGKVCPNVLAPLMWATNKQASAIAAYPEWKGGTLSKFIRPMYKNLKPKELNETAATVLKKIMETLAYLHSKNMTHNAITTHNLLLKERGDPSSLIVMGFEPKRPRRSGSAADIWDSGVVLALMLFGKNPFSLLSCGASFTAQRDYFLGRLEKEVYKANSDAKALLKWMLKKIPAERPTAQECLEHPFIKNYAWNPETERNPPWSELAGVLENPC